ncbi:hypothetical protein CPG37_06560 [Malaciobacter canalis]|uniref:Flagellar P ring chaperone FlgA n=2 Tax=Malaciobacter canalis TaxID=1912871 RepID=A0ABX4LUI7_9BACT|nr:hypothetical protein CPG37_06560 [Malaciobacter canalis]
MMLKLSFLLIFMFLNANAIDVLVAKKAIHYKSIVDPSDLMLRKVDSVEKYCKPLKLADLNNKKYEALHYIRKSSVICTKDVKPYKKEAVVFKFGALEIEKRGEIIFQNDEYIRIKRSDGKIEKIYKDGRVE